MRKNYVITISAAAATRHTHDYLKNSLRDEQVEEGRRNTINKNYHKLN
jgi:hypothetical protein